MICSPLCFFDQLLKEFEIRMKEYRQALNNLEKLVHTTGQSKYTSKMLIDTIHSQHNFSISLAAQLAKHKDTVEDLKQDYITYRRKTLKGKPLRTTEDIDPFRPVKVKKHNSFTSQALVNIPPVTPSFGNASTPFSFATSTTGTANGAPTPGFAFAQPSTSFSVAPSPSIGGGFSIPIQPASTGQTGTSQGFNFGGNGGSGFSFQGGTTGSGQTSNPGVSFGNGGGGGGASASGFNFPTGF